MSKKNRIRLYAFEPLKEGVIYTCTEGQSHYLKNVMRREIGDEIYLFDGILGEFCACISEINKKQIKLTVQNKIFDFEPSPDIWLLFAPLKKENTDIVVQKAVELGVSKIVPVKTEYTTTPNINHERLFLQAIEAAEQSRRQDIPSIEKLKSLEEFLYLWPNNRKLIYLDETGKNNSFLSIASKTKAPVALLVGPEGGFSKKELEFLKKLPYTIGVSLGKRILRAETAAIAGLSCWQALEGDWK